MTASHPHTPTHSRCVCVCVCVCMCVCACVRVCSCVCLCLAWLLLQWAVVCSRPGMSLDMRDRWVRVRIDWVHFTEGRWLSLSRVEDACLKNTLFMNMHDNNFYLFIYLVDRDNAH